MGRGEPAAQGARELEDRRQVHLRRRRRPHPQAPGRQRRQPPDAVREPVLHRPSWTRSATSPTKHVFIGDSRVVSRPGDGSKPTFFTYHPDHLQSTEYVSDNTGILTDREEYFAFGEPWVSVGENALPIDYKFNAKELDEETGFYYFGARYYDPRVSQWASPDPILFQYLTGQVNGGVFTPGNLGLYSYTLNNPTTARDPDGRAWWSKAIKIGRAVYKGGDIASAFADAIQDFQTLTDSNASLGERILAGVSLASELAPVSFSDLKDARRIVNAGLDRLDDIKDTRKALTNAGDALPKVDDSLANQANHIAKSGHTSSAAERAKEIHGALKGKTRDKVTTAVTETEEGIRVVSSSERRLRPAQRKLLKEGEIEGIGPGHAEPTGVNAARAEGLTPTGTAASRPICPNCADALNREKVAPLSPLKKRK